MAEDLGEARLRLTTDAAGLDKGLNAGEVKTKASVSRMAATLGKLKTSFGPSLLSGVGLGAGLGATQLLSSAIGGVTNAIGDAIQAGSDLNETVSKVGVVFGSSAPTILDWGKTTATAIGMSTNEALSAAATYGNLFVSMGLVGDKAADMSTRLVDLAGDLASFNNASPADVLAAIESGLNGEQEPLRKYGILLNDATLRQEALKLGLITTTTSVLPPAIKAQAAYALMLAQSGTAQGDFARTSGGLANQQRIVAAEMANASAKIGTELQPAITSLTHFIAEDFLPTAMALGGFLADVLGPVFSFLGKVVQGVDDLIVGVIRNFMLLNDFIGSIPGPWHHTAETVISANDDMREASLRNFHDTAAAAADSISASDDLREASLRNAPRIVTSYSDVAAAARDTAREVATQTGRMIDWSKRWRDRVISDARAAIDGYYDKVITAQNLAATNAEITSNRRIIASKNATDAEKADARNALPQLERDQANYLLDLAAAGDTGSKIVKTTVADLMKRLASAHGAERDAIQAEIDAWNRLTNAVNKVPVRGFGGHGPGHGPLESAGGNELAAGQASWVGEEGRELFIAPGPGVVVPHGISEWLAKLGGLPPLTGGLALAGAGILGSTSGASSVARMTAPAPTPVAEATQAGHTFNIHLLDRMPVYSVRDIGAGLRMLGEQGYFDPDRKGWTPPAARRKPSAR